MNHNPQTGNLTPSDIAPAVEMIATANSESAREKPLSTIMNNKR